MPTPDSVLKEVRRVLRAAQPETDSDRTLVERFARTWDEFAFAELVRRHGPMVLAVCRRVLRHAADADDAFQATFLILVRRATAVRDPDRLGPWLFGVAWRVANKLRTSRRPGVPFPDDLPAAECSADWPAELDAAIARLPEKYRTPVVLCHLQGLSPAEVAGHLGCAPSTVATRLFRARAALRRRLAVLGLAAPAALVGGASLQVPVALASAVGSMAAGRTIPPAAARLADGVLRSLLMTKIRWAATAAAVCLAGVGALGFRAGGQGPPPVAPPTPILPPAVAPPAAEPPPPTATTITTANFRVTAPSARIARLVADTAERTRKHVALSWLGKELPRRPETCPIAVSIGQGSGGATAFDFSDGTVFAQMRVEGTLDRLLADVVPHEVTHTVLADHFRGPLPRWADEGISLLSESAEEQARYASLNRQTLNEGSGIQLKVLFAAPDYPKNVMGFFAQSHSVTRFLVDLKDRPTFIRFVADGIKEGWEPAAKTQYGFASLNDLERAWIEALKTTARSVPPAPAAGEGLPVLALAQADENGDVIVCLPSYQYHPVTSYTPKPQQANLVKDGKSETHTYYEPVTTLQFRGGGF